MIIVIYFQQSYNNIINLFFVILIPLRFNKTSTYNFYSATIISKSSFSSQRLNLTWLRQLDLLQTDLCVPNRLGPNINNHDPPQIGSGFKIFNLVSVVCRQRESDLCGKISYNLLKRPGLVIKALVAFQHILWALVKLFRFGFLFAQLLIV